MKTHAPEVNQNIVDWLLSSKNDLVDADINNIYQWQSLVKPVISITTSSIDSAIIGGVLADRMAYAFLSGYENALQKHFAMLPAQSLAAFCVSEKGGSRPKAMKTTLTKGQNADTYTLNGQKSFVTCAEDAQWLIIAAALTEQEQNKLEDEIYTRPNIKLALIEAGAPGLTVTSSKELPFIPEIKKGSLALDNVKVRAENILPGDGYSSYVKPFSCVEGVYIMAATSAFLFRLACLFDWPKSIHEQLLSTLLAVKQLDEGDMSSPATEIMVSGVKSQLKQITELSKPLWPKLPEQHLQRLQRDCGMLLMSDKNHLTRLERAWDYYL